MTFLDQKTLLFVFVAITMILGFLMLHYAINNPSIGGPRFWALGSFSIGLGSFFFVFLSQVVVVKVISSATVVFGISMYLAGILSFKGKKINYWLIMGIPLLELVLVSVFYSVFKQPAMRIAVHFVFNALLGILAVREFLQPAARSLKRAFQLGAVLFTFFAITSLFRVFLAFMEPSATVMQQKTVNVVLFFLFCLEQPLVMFTFVILMTSELTDRLNEKIESQQKFYSIISHDIVGPLGTISQMLTLINNSENARDEEQNFLMDELEKTSKLTHDLTKNLLLWSRSQLNRITPTIQSFDLNKVVLKNVELQRYVAKSKGVSISYDGNSEIMCRGDEQMIDTVIRNLLSNAIKFSRPESEITVVCENGGDTVQIRVIDSGVGMSETILKNLFVNQNLTVKTGTGGERGTGLGLMLCKNFVEDNFGSLEVRSKENEGTEVLVTLPAS